MCFKGDIGCPFSTSWHASLGSSQNGLSGREKQHPFYLVKNSYVHSNCVCCISLYTLMNFADQLGPFYHGRAKAICKFAQISSVRLTSSGSAAGSWTMGTDPSLSFTFFYKTFLKLPLIEKTVWRKSIWSARHKQI